MSLPRIIRIKIRKTGIGKAIRRNERKNFLEKGGKKGRDRKNG